MTFKRFVHFIACGVLVAACCNIGHAQSELEWKDGQWVASSQPVGGTPQGDLDVIRLDVRKARYGQAIGGAKSFLKKWPGDPLSEEVLLLAGEAEMRRDRYWQGYEYLEKQWEQFPAGQFAERALQREYEIGEAFLNGKKRVIWGTFRLPAQAEGLDIMLKIVEHAPGSTLAERAMMRIADYHFDKKEYLEAAESYDRYITLFRNSPRVPVAMLQASRAMYNAFRGIAFDETPLIDAQQRFRIFAERYPVEAQKADVPATLKEIRDLRAHKLYATAEFYKRTLRPASEAYYYRQVTTLYGNTTWGETARQQLASMGDVTAAAPTPEPQTRPFATSRPASGPTTTSAPASEPTTGPASQPTTAPTTGPVRLEELAPQSQPQTDATTEPTTEGASEPATAPVTTGPGAEAATAVVTAEPATGAAAEAAATTQAAAAATEPAASTAPTTAATIPQPDSGPVVEATTKPAERREPTNQPSAPTIDDLIDSARKPMAPEVKPITPLESLTPATGPSESSKPNTESDDNSKTGIVVDEPSTRPDQALPKDTGGR